MVRASLNAGGLGLRRLRAAGARFRAARAAAILGGGGALHGRRLRWSARRCRAGALGPACAGEAAGAPASTPEVSGCAACGRRERGFVPRELQLS